METTSDTLKLSLKDNDDLKLELGGKKPGDKLEICLQVTVTAVDEETFEAAIDEVVTDEGPSDEESESEDDSEDPVMVVVAKNKSKNGSDSED